MIPKYASFSSSSPNKFFLATVTNTRQTLKPLCLVMRLAASSPDRLRVRVNCQPGITTSRKSAPEP